MNSLFVIILPFLSFNCHNQRTFNSATEAIVLQDIARMQTRRVPEADEAENFAAFRRLESLTKGKVNLDELAYEFHESLLNEDALANYTKAWLDWVITNRGKLTDTQLQAAIDRANAVISLTFPDQPDMLKLRIKNGVADYDTSKDQALKEKYFKNISDLKLEYPSASH
ncbi:hypothetical protein [Neolewinella lacunae]|uniref:hypothetical protein n=1 Tax=Neolewinella lacunae TaxID=1517758 RepID=UPI001CA41992|nr:hypothetical protein [Neolewinella lacunae]